MDDYEHGIVIRSLNDENRFNERGKSADAVDDLIIKVGTAPKKKFKVIEKGTLRRCEITKNSLRLFLSVIGIVPVVWLALLIAPVCQRRIAEDIAEPDECI